MSKKRWDADNNRKRGMIMDSIWTETATLPSFEHFEGSAKTDVLVIGGGITGLLCAWKLKEAGIDCIVVEADRIGSGTTKNTTAKITSQHGLIYHKMLNTMGREYAQMYLEANEAAIRAYEELCKSIDCDFEEEDAYLYFTDDNSAMDRELVALEWLGAPADFVKTIPLPFPVKGAIRFSGQAQFHPLKFLSHIAKDLKIYEKTMVKKLEKNAAITGRGSIKASKIIVTTHFPFLNAYGSYFLKLYQDRSYVLALKGAEPLKGMYLNGSGNGFSLRGYGSLVLLGGGGHRTGQPGNGWDSLFKGKENYFPDYEVCGQWAAQDCMTLDHVPYIGQYSSLTPDLFVATGFGKWGMTSAMAAAEILTDQVQGKKNPYAAVFDPSRSMMRKQLWVNGYEAVKNLFTVSEKRCPHLGCALKWNPHEHSWDCPCHGSRFSEDGALIDNPAKRDL